MHRLIPFLALTLLACGGGKKPPITTAPDGGGDGGDEESAFDGTANKGDAGADKKDECVGFDIANIEDLLLKSACEEPNVRPDTLTPIDLKGKLEVTASAVPTRPAPGGKVAITVTFANKTPDPLVLHFRIDPVARFETEAYDQPKKGSPKRVDMPAGNPPPPPKGMSAPPSTEAKSAKVTIAPNGTAHAQVTWDAVKMKWAPEKLRGTPPEKGFPRTPNGNLPKGKILIKVITPLVGVSEGVDHEVTAPKAEIEIGG